MNKIIFLFLLVIFTSCDDLELPISSHNDGLYSRYRIEFIRLKITGDKVYLNNTEIIKQSEIYHLANYARDTSRESADINAILYIDKKCNYLRVDSIIRKLRESAIHRFNFKTNSIDDSSYVRLMFGPVHAYWDSLDYEMLNTTMLQRDSLNMLVVNKETKSLYNINDSLMDKKEFLQKLENTIRDSIMCRYIINPGIENTISDVIEMTDLYNLTLHEKKESYTQAKFGQSFKEIEDSIKWEINRIRFRKMIAILPKR